MLIQARTTTLVALLAISTRGGVQTLPTREQLIANAAPSVVQITGKDVEGRDIKPGNGFFVARGLVATSYSVVQKAVAISLISSPGVVSPATLTAVNRARTLALLRVSDGGALTLNISSLSPTGAAVTAYAIAASSGASPKMAEVVVDQRPDPAQPAQPRITRPIGPGVQWRACAEPDGGSDRCGYWRKRQWCESLYTRSFNEGVT